MEEFYLLYSLAADFEGNLAAAQFYFLFFCLQVISILLLLRNQSLENICCALRDGQEILRGITLSCFQQFPSLWKASSVEIVSTWRSKSNFSALISSSCFAFDDGIEFHGIIFVSSLVLTFSGLLPCSW